MSANIALKNVGFSFKEICKIAKQIKPEGWCIVVSDQRLVFVEVILPQGGPATLQKQLILNIYMEVEAYVGAKKLTEEALSTINMTSVADLDWCLRAFASFDICLGNRNFHRPCTTDSDTKVEYWKHGNCLLLCERDIMRKERCCDKCFTLNNFLTKKQRQQVIPYLYDEYPEKKRIKTEIVIKEEF